MTEQPCSYLSELVVTITASFCEILSEFKVTEARTQLKISLQKTIRNIVQVREFLQKRVSFKRRSTDFFI
jgi:hypothetical protein